MKHLIRRLGRPATPSLRASRSPLLQRLCDGSRSFHSSQAQLEEKTTSKKSEGKDKENLSFRGQLYESTAQRLQRERASEAQYIQAARARGREPRTLALSAGQ